MSHPFQITLEAFISTPSLANAKKVVAHARKRPFVLCMLTEDHAGMVRNAERIVDDAKNPAKIKQSMQAELRARFPGMKIEVI